MKHCERAWVLEMPSAKAAGAAGRYHLPTPGVQGLYQLLVGWASPDHYTSTFLGVQCMAEGQLREPAGLRAAARGKGAEQPQFWTFLPFRDKTSSLQPVVMDGDGSGWVCRLFCMPTTVHSVSPL